MKNKQKKESKALNVLKPEENKEEIKSVKGIFPKEMRTNKIKNEMDEIKKWEEKVKTKDLTDKANKYKYDFQQYETVRSFSESIYTDKINIDEAEMDQSNLSKKLVEFNGKSRPKTVEGKDKKGTTFESVNVLYEG